MFHRLKFEMIPTSGKAAMRRFEGDHKFNAGMTGIFGNNEAGKSLRFEMLMFALWGTKALRGSVSEYHALSSQVDFEVKGVTYRVLRSLKECRLYVMSDDIKHDVASGTKPVNAAIRKIFGYGMEVFLLANASMQDDTQSLTNMKPTARKQLVDEVVGLDALDKISDMYGKEQTELGRAYDSLARMVESIAAPAQPADYVASAQLKVSLEQAQAELQEKIKITSKLDALPQREPEAPRPFQHDLKDIYAARAEREVKKKRLAEIANSHPQRRPEPILSEENYAACVEYLKTDLPERWEAYNHYMTSRSRLVPPTGTYDLADLSAMLETLRYQQVKGRADQIKANSQVECPHCKELFALEQDTVTEMMKPFEGFVPVELPGLTKQGIEQEIQRIEAWKAFNENNPEVAKPEGEYSKRSVVEDTVRNHERQVALLENYDTNSKLMTDLAAELAADETDYDALIKQGEKCAADEAKYAAAIAQWQERQVYFAEVEPRLRELEGVETKVREQQAMLASAQAYEQAVAVYNAKKDQQDKIQTELADITVKLERIKLIRKALGEIKPMVKKYLMPSLNTVASNLLSQMTNGERNSVVIDENFDILIDAQKVETLSGSGKAVANLAIRIALGTVLTHKVFSVFLADEVDAAMRGERAQYTAQCLQNLTGVIKQVMIITHKDIEVAQRIDL